MGTPSHCFCVLSVWPLHSLTTSLLSGARCCSRFIFIMSFPTLTPAIFQRSLVSLSEEQYLKTTIWVLRKAHCSLDVTAPKSLSVDRAREYMHDYVHTYLYVCGFLYYLLVWLSIHPSIHLLKIYEFYRNIFTSIQLLRFILDFSISPFVTPFSENKKPDFYYP